MLGEAEALAYDEMVRLANGPTLALSAFRRRLVIEQLAIAETSKHSHSSAAAAGAPADTFAVPDAAPADDSERGSEGGRRPWNDSWR
jgi:hypothetical protein